MKTEKELVIWTN